MAGDCLEAGLAAVQWSGKRTPAEVAAATPLPQEVENAMNEPSGACARPTGFGRYSAYETACPDCKPGSPAETLSLPFEGLRLARESSAQAILFAKLRRNGDGPPGGLLQTDPPSPLHTVTRGQAFDPIDDRCNVPKPAQR